jgi:hypothetical protein
MSFIQDSIQKTRLKLHEYNRVKAVVTKQTKEEMERKNALMEQIVDTVCAETGLRCEVPEDREMILLHVKQVLLDARRRKQEEEEPQWDPDKWA